MEYKSHLGATSFLLPFILAILCTSLIRDVIAPKVTTTQGATKTGQKKIKIDDNISWEDYKKICGKKYSPDDDKEHKGAFEKIKAIVKAHNANPHKKFTMALNAKADRTKKEKMAHGKRQRQAGYHSVKSEQPKTRTKRSPTIYPTEYPANFDWTEPKNSSIYVTPVRDQGETGYCWALASADVLTMQYRRRSGDSAILSPQAIIDCASKEPKEGAKSGPDEDDSDGGFETDAFNYANEIQGLPTDKTYPLTPREEISDADLKKEIFIVKKECRIGDQDKELRRFIQPVSIHNPVKDPAKIEDGVQAMLYIHGPVIATILISDELDSFHFYSKGIYTGYEKYNEGKYMGKSRQKTCIDVQESDKDSEFHSVIIVGYGTDPAQHAGFRDFWRIKNTWGDDWGEDGTMRLGRNQGNLCGIATWAVVPIVIPINFRYLERGGLDPARLPGGRLLHVQPAFIEIPTGAHSTTTLNFENRSNTHWLVYRIKILEDDRREFIKISADLKVIPPQESVVIKVEVMKGMPQAHGPAYKVAEILVEYVAVKKKIIFKDGKDFAEFMND